MEKFTRNTLLSLILFIVIGRYFDSLLPIKLFGISLFSVGIFFFCIMCLFLLNVKQISTKSMIYFFCILAFLLIIKIQRSIIYETEQDLIINFIYSFSVYLPPMFLLLTKKIDNKFIFYAEKLLLIILVLQSLLAILFMLNLPTINILNDNFPLNYFRYVGIMGGANVNSNFNALIVSILILGPLKHTSFSKQVIVIIIGVVSAIPSLSRGPIIYFIILFVFILFNKLNAKPLTKMAIPLVILGIAFAAITYSNEIAKVRSFGRLYDTIEESGDANRASKYRLGVELLLMKNLQSFAFGAPIESQITDSVEVSDNSFLQESLVKGVPFVVLFIIFLAQITKPLKRLSKELIVYYFILFLTLFFNNAILWIPWTFYAAFGYWIIRTKEIPTKNKSKTTYFSGSKLPSPQGGAF